MCIRDSSWTTCNDANSYLTKQPKSDNNYIFVYKKLDTTNTGRMEINLPMIDIPEQSIKKKKKTVQIESLQPSQKSDSETDLPNKTKKRGGNIKNDGQLPKASKYIKTDNKDIDKDVSFDPPTYFCLGCRKVFGSLPRHFRGKAGQNCKQKYSEEELQFLTKKQFMSRNLYQKEYQKEYQLSLIHI